MPSLPASMPLSGPLGRRRAPPAMSARQLGLRASRALAAAALFATLPVWADGPSHERPSAPAPVPPAATATPSATNDPLAHWLLQHGLLPKPALADARGAAAAAPASAPVPADMPAPMRDASAELVIAALNFLEIPYRWGGNHADEGFDCSGFTRFVFATSLGLVLPRRAEEQARASALQPVRRDALRPGDLVFFNTMRRAFSHVGIYIGDGRFIHAPRTGAEVRIEQIGSRYWSQRFNGARRAGEQAAAASAG